MVKFKVGVPVKSVVPIHIPVLNDQVDSAYNSDASDDAIYNEQSLELIGINEDQENQEEDQAMDMVVEIPANKRSCITCKELFSINKNGTLRKHKCN
jgi:hypothetical protein